MPDGEISIFLFNFEHVHFHVPTLRLILAKPIDGAVGA